MSLNSNATSIRSQQGPVFAHQLAICALIFACALSTSESLGESDKFLITIKSRTAAGALEIDSLIKVRIERKRLAEKWLFLVSDASADIWQRLPPGPKTGKLANLAPHIHAEKDHQLLAGLYGKEVEYRVGERAASLVKDDTLNNKLTGPVSAILNYVMRLNPSESNLLGKELRREYPILLSERNGRLLRLYISACVDDEIQDLSVELIKAEEPIPLYSRTVLKGALGVREVSFQAEGEPLDEWIREVELLPSQLKKIVFLRDKGFSWLKIGSEAGGGQAKPGQ